MDVIERAAAGARRRRATRRRAAALVLFAAMLGGLVYGVVATQTGARGRGTAAGPGKAAASEGSSAARTIPAGPLAGLKLFVCDEAGNRIIEVNAAKQIVWTAQVPAPDDLAPTPQGTLVVNSDEHDQVYEVSLATGRIEWVYGRRDRPGGAPGVLSIPEDSFGVPGAVMISDPGNQRVIEVSHATKAIVWQYGHTGVAGTGPGYLYTINDAVPLRGGDVLISEAGPGFATPRVVEVTPGGAIAWQASLRSLHYLSDAMPIGAGRYVAADYHTPGRIVIFDRQGRIRWSYGPPHGPGMLSHPSSAEQLPNGDFLVSDDMNDRVVVIDPRSRRIIWQYGVTGVKGMGSGKLMGPTDAKAAGILLPPWTA